MATITASDSSWDKSRSSQGLLIVIDESLSGDSFRGGSRGTKIIEGLIKAGKFIYDHYDDILVIIGKLPPEKEKQKDVEHKDVEQKDVEQKDAPTIVSPPLPSSPLPHKSLINFLKGEYIIPLEILPNSLALAGIGIVFGFGFAFMLLSNISNVSTFSKGDQLADTFCKVTNSKRFASIFLHLDEVKSQAIDKTVNGLFALVGDDGPISPDQFFNVLSLATTKSFCLCMSTKKTFTIVFRGGFDICFVGGALINGAISPICLGSMKGLGEYRIGKFLIETMNMQFVVMGSSVLLDLLSYEDIVDCVIAKGYDNAQNVVKAALARNPDMVDEIHVAVLFLSHLFAC